MVEYLHCLYGVAIVLVIAALLVTIGAANFMVTGDVFGDDSFKLKAKAWNFYVKVAAIVKRIRGIK